MAIALRGTPTFAVSVSGGATLTVAVPTGTVSGDVMVAIAFSGGGTGAAVPAAPSGWTALDNNASGPFSGTYYRVAASEPASYNFVTAGTAGGGAMIASYSGVDNTSPINAHGAFTTSGGSATSYTAASVTTTVNGCQSLVLVACKAAEASIATPTGYTQEALNTATYGIMLADLAQSTAGATGSQTGSYSTGTNSAGVQIALAPVSVAAPTNTVAPSVSGTATVGSTLSTTDGTWTGSPSFTYQWTRDGANISSATSNTYVSQAADVGHAVGCTVTATNAGGSASQASSNTITVTAAGSLSTVVGKTGTSGTAVMQKAKSGWTYITGKTGTSGTAVDQKGAGSFTKIKGH